MRKREKPVCVSISMPPSMAKEIRVLAAQQDKSRSQLVREILEKTLMLPSGGGAQIEQGAS